MKILLIDDEAELLTMTARRLQRKGVEAICASNLAEAKSAFDAHQAEIEGIVSDLFLGNENGLNFFETVSVAGFQKIFVLVTGDEDGDPRVRQFKFIHPNFHCLQKPYSMDELLNLLREGSGRVA